MTNVYHPIWVAGLLMSCVVTAADAQAPKKLALQVRSESWVANSGFDQSGFVRQCADAKIQLVPEDGPDGIVLIEYVESKGSGYSLFGVGTPTAFGTHISSTLTLLSPTDAQSRLTIKASASTPYSGVATTSLHEAAVRTFKSRPQYRFACDAIAAVLGSRQHAEKLLPWAVFEREGLALLETTAFVAGTPREHAFLAVARRDFVGIDKLGAAAAEPVGLLIQSYYKDMGFGRRTVTSVSKEDLASLAAAIGALATTADPGTAKILEALLKECLQWRRDMVEPIALPAIVALGKVGNAFSLVTLGEWSKCEKCTDPGQQAAVQRMSAAASDAATSVRSRLVRK